MKWKYNFKKTSRYYDSLSLEFIIKKRFGNFTFEEWNKFCDVAIGLMKESFEEDEIKEMSNVVYGESIKRMYNELTEKYEWISNREPTDEAEFKKTRNAGLNIRTTDDYILLLKRNKAQYQSTWITMSCRGNKIELYGQGLPDKVHAKLFYGMRDGYEYVDNSKRGIREKKLKQILDVD